MPDTKITKIVPQPAEAEAQTRNGGRDRLERSSPGTALSSTPRVPVDQTSKRHLDQIYTRDDVAQLLYDLFKGYFDPTNYVMIEPSAGTGPFYKLLPVGSLGYDLEPKCEGVEKADFLTVEIDIPREKVAVIGNPPFGKNASLAVRFFNHAAGQSSVIAFIVPRSFKKASIENRLDRKFHLVREMPVPKDAFLFDDQPYDVPCVFQIWERRETKRVLRPTRTTHSDFKFTTVDRAHFAIRRIGARAGHIDHDLNKSASSHYFIKGLAGRNVEAIMRQLDFASVAGNTAGCPSIAKSEIVALYAAKIRKSAVREATIAARTIAPKAMSSVKGRRRLGSVRLQDRRSGRRSMACRSRGR